MHVLLKILSIIVLSTSLNFAASVEFTFDKWVLENVQKYVADIKLKNNDLSSQDIQRAKERLTALKSSINYASMVAELERIISADLENYELWLELAETYAKDAKGPEERWESRNKARLASIKAYQLAKTTIEKAQALLIYGDVIYEGSDERQKILTLISSDAEFKKMKQSDRFKVFMPLCYVSYELLTNSAVPEVRFSFSQPITSDQIKDYVEISPKIDGKVTVVDREIRINGFSFSTTYDVTIKAGLKSQFGDVLEQPVKVGLKIAEQNARLSFKNNKFILQKTENLTLPLESVNIDKVNVRIVRLADKVLAGNMTRPYDATFLKNLYAHEFKHIEEVQGTTILNVDMDVKGDRNKAQTTLIPLSKIEKDLKPGAYVIYVSDKTLSNSNINAMQWVMISDIGLTTFMGDNGLFVDVRKLSTANAQKGIRVDLIAHNQEILASKESDGSGRVLFEKELLLGKDGNRPLMLACYGEGGEFTLLDLTKAPLDLSDLPISGREVKESEDLYIYIDRGVYRPGETIHFHGLLRNHKLTGVSNAQLTFKLVRPDGVAIKQEIAQGNEVGFFEHKFALLDSSPTGLWTIQGFLDPKAKTPLFETKVSVEDFTPARMTVKLNLKDQILNAAKSIEADIKAEYLFGGTATNLNAEAVVILTKNTNPFPDYKKFVFGDALEELVPQRLELALTGLDDKGNATIAIDGKAIHDASFPLQGQLRVNVFDRGGRPQLGTARFNAFTKPIYIGIKHDFERISGDKDEATFEIIAVGEDGKQVPLPSCSWKLSKEDVTYNWYQSGNAWRYNVKRSPSLIDQGTLAIGEKEPFSLALKNIDTWGDYILEVGDFERGLVTKIRFTKGWGRTDRLDVPDLIKLRLDKESYKPGEAITLNVESPINGNGLLTIASHAGVLHQENVKIQKGQTTLKFNAKPEFGIGAYIILNTFRALPGEESDKALPIRAVGIEWFKMDSTDKTLNVTLENKPLGKPREAFSVDVTVDNAKGEDQVYLSLAAVDEGILLLTDYKNPDPIHHFFGKKKLNVELRDLYGFIIDSASGQKGAFHTGGDEGALAKNLAALSKKSFKIISLYSGLVNLQNGKATIPFDMPDFNGKVRLVCVAASKNKVGFAVSSITIKDPIIVEALLPKFLAPGDKSQMILSIHNQSGSDDEISVSLKTEGPAKLEKENLTIKMEKDTEQVFQVPMTSDAVGDSKISIKVESKAGSQEYTYEISTRDGKAFRSSNRAILLEQNKPLTLSTKDVEGFIPETAKIYVALSKYPWNAKKAAMDLDAYPYACIEQSVSRGFGMLYLRNENKEPFEQKVNLIISKIAQEQDFDGNLDLWSGSNSSKGNKIWLSAYALDFLIDAQKTGFIIPSFTLDNLKTYLKSQVNRLSSSAESSVLDGAAYALYALNKADAIEPGDIRYFYDNFYDNVKTILGKSFVIHALSSYGDETRLKDALDKLSFEKYEISSYGTDLRDSVACLKILLATSKQNEVAAKILEPTLPVLMKRVQEQITAGRSLSTQENAWICNDAVVEAEALTLNIDGQKVGSENTVFKEYSGTDLDHKLENLGGSSIFALITISGQKHNQKAESNGLKITRKFYNLQGQELQKLDLTQGQTIVAVIEGEKLTSKFHNILLVDTLPAGVQLEALPQLSWIGDLTKLAFSSLRDDRYVASFELDSETKEFKVAYLIRAITLGEYTYPGSFVEDMYDPGVFAQNQGLKLYVTERK